MSRAASVLSTPDYYEYSGRVRELLVMVLDERITRDYALQRLNELDEEVEFRKPDEPFKA